jgi:ankyrin repeat protein
VEVVKILLAHGADVSVRDAQGRTLLWMVDHPPPPIAQGRREAVIRLLRAAGAKE